MVALHQELANQGFDILAFPCDQFGGQDPGTDQEIKAEAHTYGVTFTMMSKIFVNGAKTSPVYRFLKSQKGCGGKVTWNFRTKFLISRDGLEITRFDGVKARDLQPHIERLLAAAAPPPPPLPHPAAAGPLPAAGGSESGKPSAADGEDGAAPAACGLAAPGAAEGRKAT